MHLSICLFTEYFCDDTIDIKVEVLPIVEHMEFIQSSHDDQPDPTDPLAIDFGKLTYKVYNDINEK